MSFKVTYEKRLEVGLKLVKYNGHRRWKKSEDAKLKELHSQGMSYTDIALSLGRTYSSTISRARIKNLPSRVCYFKKNEDDYIKRFYGIKLVSEIADYLKRSRKSVSSRAFSLGLKSRYTGENHWRSVHSDHDIELMRQLHDEGISIAEISRKMEINYCYAKRVLSYKFRTDLTFH